MKSFLREGMWEPRWLCPHCGSTHVVRATRSQAGKPRCLCRGCGRSFNEPVDPTQAPSPDDILPTRPDPRDRYAMRVFFSAFTRLHGKSGSHRNRLMNGVDVLLDALHPVQQDDWHRLWEARFEGGTLWSDLLARQHGEARWALHKALGVLLATHLVRPSYPWLLDNRLGETYRLMYETTHAQDHERLMQAAQQVGATLGTLDGALRSLARLFAHTGKHLAEVNVDDLRELRAAHRDVDRPLQAHNLIARLLFHSGVLPEPLADAGYFRGGARTAEALVDRYPIRNREVRDVFVRYLKEREPGMDFNSLTSLAHRLVKLFWCDIELHHPEVTSLNVPREVVEAWKARVRVLGDGGPRRGLEEMFFAIRSFYLDILEWSVTRPEWAAHAVPSPIIESDLAGHHKALRERQARMHDRIRSLKPLVLVLLNHVRDTHEHARGLLDAALAVAEGEVFEHVGVPYRRVRQRYSERRRRGVVVPLLAERVVDGERINCRLLEDRAFWVWAVVEVLRLTGIRCEEMLELTHLSVRQHNMANGQQVLLLQIAPSKQDRERVLPVCPELAHVLAAIVKRIKDPSGVVPSVPRYDPLEHKTTAPMPFLFQGGYKRLLGVMNHDFPNELLRGASKALDLRDRDGAPVTFTPHDFRRIFATDAVNGGLPLHIAAKLLGHLDLNTTRGYVAVYPEEVIEAYQAHLTRRRTFRSEVDYREPTPEEWAEFEQHFRRRKMALGDCYRPYHTPCPHEHACVRCPMLRMDPVQFPRLLQIEADTERLLDEARGNGWEGELQGLEVTLQAIEEKKGQIQRLRS